MPRVSSLSRLEGTRGRFSYVGAEMFLVPPAGRGTSKRKKVVKERVIVKHSCVILQKVQFYGSFLPYSCSLFMLCKPIFKNKNEIN